MLINNYRIFLWGDKRVEMFLKYELGELNSGKLVTANLIARFTPNNDDLTDLQYEFKRDKVFLEVLNIS
jgi:hypothetical protein